MVSEPDFSDDEVPTDYGPKVASTRQLVVVVATISVLCLTAFILALTLM